MNARHTSAPQLIAATLLTALLSNAALAAAPPELQPATTDFQRAESLYLQGSLSEAIPLYQRVTTTGSDDLRIRSYVRLSEAHGRLGLLVEAVQDGLNARTLLKDSDEAALRAVDLRLGEGYFLLGHYGDADDYLRRGLTVEAAPLRLSDRLRALTTRARCAERRGDPVEAGRIWAEVERLALDELDRPGAALGAEERAEYTWRLADSYRFQHRNAAAIAHLQPLLLWQERRDDRVGQRDTCRRLAEHYAASDKYDQAEKYLRAALAFHGPAHDPATSILRGDLAFELLEVLQRQGKHKDAVAAGDQAADSYRSVLKQLGEERAASVWGVAAFWKLSSLYQRTSQYRQALYLADEQSGHWQALAVLDPSRVRAEQGSLQFLLGTYHMSLPLLRKAVKGFEQQNPVNLVALPQALLNLGIAEYRTVDWTKREPWLKALGRAEEAADRVLDLYRVHRLPQDLVVVEAYHLQGVCQAERGSYHLALARFRAGTALCAKLGRSADKLHSMLLLDMALLHKSQGDLDEALRLCREARALFRSRGETDELETAAFDAADVVLYTARGRLEEAFHRAERLLELCRKHHVQAGPLLEIALHCQALYELSQGGDVQAAQTTWTQLRTLQEKEGAAPLLPRTLNYLGLAAQLQGRWSVAESMYRKAAELQRDNGAALAVTHYLSFWGLAGVAQRQGKPSQERDLLRQAIEVAEAARLRTYGAAAERARYFSQFAPAYERLVASCVEAGDVEGALAAATRGRSRTLMDQLRLANLDPLAELQGPAGAELRRQEEQVRRRLDGLRARARLGAEAEDPPRLRQLLIDLEQAERDYAAVWREVLDASPVYRRLAAADPADKLDAAGRDRLLAPRTLLLVYYLGRDRSYLLLLGRKDFPPRAFELTLPAGDKKVPVTQADVRVLVSFYRRFLEEPGLSPQAVVELRDRPVGPLSLQETAAVLLPPQVRDCIRASGADSLVVVPDGALHQLPLEALILKSGSTPRYVMDELPPIAYVPSPALLVLLAERPSLAAGPLSLLSVCNPAYQRGQARQVSGPAAEIRFSPQFFARLPPLPFSSLESQRIGRLFAPAEVTVLEGRAATESAVKAAIKGKRIVHLAVHGFADESFGNLYGGLILTAPATEAEAKREDGVLTLHEIYQLPLQDCELAVLSACRTNSGPQQPLEAGATLASGFLGAGARHVVASHWRVDDQATAALMEAFFAEVLRAARNHEPIRYAAALQTARRSVRARPEWSAPFFWAPFVVVGPGADERRPGVPVRGSQGH